MNRRRFMRMTGSAALVYPLGFTWNPVLQLFRLERPDASDVAGPANGDFAESLVRGVARSYESPTFNLADVPAGELFAVIGFAGEFDSSDNASRGLDMIAAQFAQDVEEQTVEVDVDPFGDDRRGLETAMPAADAEVGEIVFALLLVRKQHVLQILVGVSAESPMDDVLRVARRVDPRWPSNILWDAIPVPADLPGEMILTDSVSWTLEDFGLDPEGDVPTPAPTREPVEEGSLAFTVELRLGGLAMRPDGEGGFCSGVGSYAVFEAGATFRVRDLATGDELLTALLSRGMLQESSCSWKLAVLGLPPRDVYAFQVGDFPVGTARYEDIENGEVVVFEMTR
jgi:hypothetical protein